MNDYAGLVFSFKDLSVLETQSPVAFGFKGLSVLETQSPVAFGFKGLSVLETQSLVALGFKKKENGLTTIQGLVLKVTYD